MLERNVFRGSQSLWSSPGEETDRYTTTLKERVIDVLTMVSIGYNGHTRKEWPNVSRRVRKAFIKDIEATRF